MKTKAIVGNVRLRLPHSNSYYYNLLEVAPLNKPLGINGYSPIEEILLGLAEELQKINPNILVSTLCAKGSRAPNPIETTEAIGDWSGINAASLLVVYKKHFEKMMNMGEIDIIHNHTPELPEFLALRTRRTISIPIVHTVHIPYEPHERLDHLPKHKNYYVAISESHKKELEKKGLSISRVVYNGIDAEDIPFQTEKEDYILSLGRITPNKGQEIAIESAKISRSKIVIAGPIQKKEEDLEYYNEKIRPRIELQIDFENDPEDGMRQIINTDKKVIYVGEVGKSKYLLFGKAKAFMFPIQWSEPFGLVMTESLAAGTPVIAYDRGSVSEIVQNGVNGFIHKQGDLESLAKSISLVHNISPLECRKRAMHFFSKQRMAKDYENLFEEILSYRQLIMPNIG